MSINLCTDPLLVRLADRDQVAGVTRYALDPARSWSLAEARGLPVIAGTAEEVLTLRPDLVLAGRFTRRATRELLRRHGIRLVELDAVRSVEEARAQIRQVGALLGHPDRADAAVARIDAALARTRRAAEASRATILPLQRRGWVSGGGTLLSSLLAHAGLDNAGSRLSRGLGRQATLEEIVASRPDYLLLSETGTTAEDQGTAFLQHEALRRLYPADRRITLPDNTNVFCGGPTLADGIDRLAAALERVRRP